MPPPWVAPTMVKPSMRAPRFGRPLNQSGKEFLPVTKMPAPSSVGNRGAPRAANPAGASSWPGSRSIRPPADQALDRRAPAVDLLGRHLAGVEGHAARAPALELDRLPHDDQLVVDARGDQDQVGRGGGVDRVLDRRVRVAPCRGDAVHRVELARRTDTLLGPAAAAVRGGVAGDAGAHGQGHADGRLDWRDRVELMPAGHGDLVVAGGETRRHVGDDPVRCSSRGPRLPR